METKQFPNGFISWMETHYEIVAKLTLELVKDEIDSCLVRDRYDSQGTGGMYELAEELTDEFETANQGRLWEGDYFDTLDTFINLKLK